MASRGCPVLWYLNYWQDQELMCFYSGDLDPEGMLIAQKLSGFIREDLLIGIWQRKIIRSASRRRYFQREG